MGLIAVPRAQLLKNALADLLETELQNLRVDEIDARRVIDLGVGEVERCRTEGDRARVEAWLEDLGANLIGRESRQVRRAVPLKDEWQQRGKESKNLSGAGNCELEVLSLH